MLKINIFKLLILSLIVNIKFKKRVVTYFTVFYIFVLDSNY